MVAAEGGHVKTVVTLVEHGADVNMKGKVSCWNQQLKCVHWYTWSVIV